MNFTAASPKGAGGSSSRRTASTCGIPLPAACGENLRTSHAAIIVAAVQVISTIEKPARFTVCPGDQCSSQAIGVLKRKPQRRSRGSGGCADEERY